MKQIRLLLLCVLSWLLAGCTADPLPAPDGAAGDPVPKNPHAVPIEQALADLESLLIQIDTPDADGAVTRSGGVRRVKSVATISPQQLSATRTAATADVEDLLYIVNFEQEAGYALLGADDRLESVYAIIDEGSLTPAQMQYAATATEEQAEADGEFIYPLQMVARAAIGGIGGFGGGIDVGGGGGGGGFKPVGPITDFERWGPDYVGTEYGPWKTVEEQKKLTNTKWRQGSPYNYFCPKKNGEYCLAGCVPIATAQMLAYNALINNKRFYQMGNRPISEAMWINIKNAVEKPHLVRPTTSGEAMTPETMAVAYFINVMGEAVGATYGVKNTSAPASNVKKLLAYLGSIGHGYSNIAQSSINTDKAREMIYLKKLPFYYEGKSSDGYHAWLLDGWLHRQRTVTTFYRDFPIQYHTERAQFVHINFGWGVSYDGYYTFNAFNVGAGSIHPSGVSTDQNYNHSFTAITYDLA